MNDGGPAFPWVHDTNDTSYKYYGGMSLRDWFAGQALAMVADPHILLDNKNIPIIAARCVQLADALLVALQKPA